MNINKKKKKENSTKKQSFEYPFFELVCFDLYFSVIFHDVYVNKLADIPINIGDIVMSWYAGCFTFRCQLKNLHRHIRNHKYSYRI